MRISDGSSDVCSSDLPGNQLADFMLRLAAEGAIEGALAVRATQFRHKSSYGGAKRGAAVLILAPGHPITIWQLGDMGSMSRLAPRRQADVNKCGYREIGRAHV